METKSYYIEGISLIKHSFHGNSIYVSKIYILYLYRSTSIQLRTKIIINHCENFKAMKSLVFWASLAELKMDRCRR